MQANKGKGARQWARGQQRVSGEGGPGLRPLGGLAGERWRRCGASVAEFQTVAGPERASWPLKTTGACTSLWCGFCIRVAIAGAFQEKVPQPLPASARSRTAESRPAPRPSSPFESEILGRALAELGDTGGRYYWFWHMPGNISISQVAAPMPPGLSWSSPTCCARRK